MFTHLSLRLRLFLFFCLLAVGAAVLAAGALAFGWSRSEETLPTAPFITAFILFAFLNSGLALGVWLLFDEHVAKPIDMLSANLRLRAHSGVETSLDAGDAKYLGDLAPAASALSESVGSSVLDTAEKVAHETQRLRAETERLTALLTESPVATILLNPAREIVLYDGQAADVLSQIAVPRLKAPIGDYFEAAAFDDAVAQLSAARPEVTLTLRDRKGTQTYAARIKALGQDGHMVFIDAQSAHTLARPLVFDFDLMNAPETTHIDDMPLDALCYVAFDTETTGLSVQDDAILQIGAVRVLNGRLVEGETIDTYVAPGRPIPPASTRIHHISDADVEGAPDLRTAGRALHHFARDAVLVAHNAPFDIGLLKKGQGEMDVTWDHPVLDTVLLSAVVFGTTAEHSLDALCARLAINIPEADRHTALGDARATGAALVKLLHLLKGKGIVTFGDLIAQTKRHNRLLEDSNV